MMDPGPTTASSRMCACRQIRQSSPTVARGETSAVGWMNGTLDIYRRLECASSIQMADPTLAGFSLEPHARRIDKPWGYEILLSPTDVPYTAKLIHVKAGRRLSLQLHDTKIETQTLVAGRGVLVLEGADGQLHDIQMQPGVGYHIAVGQRHRLCAADDEDATVFEASTPEA